MARQSKKATLAASQDKAAPYLFDEQQLPVRLDVLELVKQGNHKHTGQRLLENEKMCLRLVELILAKWGVRKISREMNVSKWTVKAARNALVARGEMAPWKERVVANFSEFIEAGSESLVEDMEEGRFAAREKSVAVGIIWDKRALAVGEPTSIDLQARAVANPGSLTVEKLQAFVRSLDPKSVGQPPIPQQTSPPALPDATCDATPGTGAGGSEGVEGAPTRLLRVLERSNKAIMTDQLKPVFDVTEPHVCQQGDMSMDEIRKRRGHFLVHGVHWEYVKKRVLLSRVGALILLGTRGAILEPPNAKNPATGDCEPPTHVLPPFKGELIVWARGYYNPNILSAYIPESEPENPLNLVTVIVRSNENFLRGMKLPGPAPRRLEETGPGRFLFSGQCPRWKGRW